MLELRTVRCGAVRNILKFQDRTARERKKQQTFRYNSHRVVRGPGGAWIPGLECSSESFFILKSRWNVWPFLVCECLHEIQGDGRWEIWRNFSRSRSCWQNRRLFSRIRLKNDSSVTDVRSDHRVRASLTILESLKSGLSIWWGDFKETKSQGLFSDRFLIGQPIGDQILALSEN